ncbi:MAG TPA: nucleotidyltransferase domain-containing protein [Gemmataceae bacterium]|nr:nucleotidyltransferase domain-containing protein [Gemmataceae bacterium]
MLTEEEICQALHASRVVPQFAHCPENQRLIMPTSAKRTTTRATINRMVERIVAKFQPRQVILFGSQARGDARTDSDVDLLVVMDFEGSAFEKGLEISLALHDILVPKDIIVTRPEDFAWRKDIVGTIEWPAAREGKVLYARS